MIVNEPIYGIDKQGVISRLDGKPIDEQDLYNALTARLFKSVDPKHIMTHVLLEGITTPLLGGKMVIPSIERLQLEVKALKEMMLWSVFDNTLRDQANRTMINESKTFEDMRSGKMLNFALGVMNNIVKTVENFPTDKKKQWYT